MKRIISIFLFFSVLFGYQTSVAAVKASVNQSEVFQGDPVTLTIENNQNNNAQPDLSLLQANFEILGTSTSSQINIINGNRSYKKTWSIDLQPKSLGEISIPAISVGAEKTQAITVTVNQLPPELAEETSKHVFIESSVDIKDDVTYVQQQIPYTVKLFYDASMHSGEIVSPKIENANVRDLGNDRKYQVIRAGKKFLVVEKHFVISPEKSGKLIIPPIIVKGRIALKGGQSQQAPRRLNSKDPLNQFFPSIGNDPFFNSPFEGFFNTRPTTPTRPFTISSQSMEVNVLPVPSLFQGKAWLPAEEVLVKDSWSKNPPTLKVGEPVTRQLVLQVKGLAGSQIPEIQIPKPQGVKVYPDQARSETPNDGNTVYGVQRMDITYIPDKTGKVIFPEIKIDWWDVKERLAKVYTIPEWNLNISGSPVDDSVPTPSELLVDENPEAEISLGQTLEPIPKYWGREILGTVIFGGFALLMALFFINRRKTGHQRLMEQSIKTQPLVDIDRLRRSLLSACEQNDKQLASKLLIKMAQAQWNDTRINNLGTLANNIENGKATIKALENSLYSKQAENWDGQALKQLVKRGLRKNHPKIKKHNQNELAPLYPV